MTKDYLSQENKNSKTDFFLADDETVEWLNTQSYIFWNNSEEAVLYLRITYKAGIMPAYISLSRQTDTTLQKHRLYYKVSICHNRTGYIV